MYKSSMIKNLKKRLTLITIVSINSCVLLTSPVVLSNASSEEEVKKKIGFWAQPLPTPDKPETNKRYIGKK